MTDGSDPLEAFLLPHSLVLLASLKQILHITDNQDTGGVNGMSLSCYLGA